MPNREAGIRLIHILSKRAHTIWNRWRTADELAKRGRNLLDIPRRGPPFRAYEFEVTEADAHATYRELIRRTGDPLPNVRTLNAAIGNTSHSSVPTCWPIHSEGHPRAGLHVGIEEIQAGLYPTTDDLYCLALLFMARSGWNPTTTYALDCRSVESWTAQYSDELVWLHSYKARGNSWQDCLSPENHSTHCYQIVVRLLERNRTLRALVAADQSRCALPDVATFSPWLGVSGSGGHRSLVHVLEGHAGGALNKYLAKLVAEHNSKIPPSKTCLPKIVCTDLRDIFAEAVHRDGNYSIFVTQLALGHKRTSSTRKYLRSAAWRQESELKLNELVTTLFDQIEVHKMVDLTILRAAMDGIKVTSEQVARLEHYRKNRTYSGLGCTDPTRPPEWIDPDNPRDGTTLCAQGHRCPVCPRGKVFSDSLDHLARQLAELQWKREQCGDIKWYESTDSADFEIIAATLRQWPPDQVEKHLSEWRQRIASGKHHVLILTGGRH